MLPTEILKHEHQLILMVLDAAEREARAMAGGAAVNADRLNAFVDFIRNFADHCHHAKEENQAALAADFERVERDEIGDGVHQRYDALARELAGG